MRKLINIAVGLVSTAIVVWELPAIGRFLLKVIGALTTFDFFYERNKDPTWLGKALALALEPPPGTALLVAVAGLFLIYWSTKPRAIRMSPPVIGMLLSVISFTAFGVWYLVRYQTGASPIEKSQSSSAAADDIQTHLNLKFGVGTQTPIATSLSNIWRWYALQTQAQTRDGSQRAVGWTVFVTLDKPTNVAQVVLQSDKPLPPYEVKDRDARSLIIAFSGEIADNEVQIKVLTKVPAVVVNTPPVVVLADSPPPASPTTPKLTKPYYSTAEIEKIIDLLKEMRKVYAEKAEPAYTRSHQLCQSWNQKLNSGGVKLLAEDARNIANQINETVNAFQAIANEPHGFTEIVRPVFQTGQDPSELLAKLHKIANDADHLSAASNKINVSYFFEPQIPELSAATQKFGNWLEQIRRNIDSRTNEFREWRNP